MSSPGEEWRSVHRGVYQVSDLGRVRRVAPGAATKPGRILGPYDDGKGYLKVSLCAAGRRTIRFVHSLIAEAFIGECPAGMEVNHKDCNPKNNRPDNLEYVTTQQNTAHAKAANRMAKGSAVPSAKLNEAKVLEIRRLAKEGVKRKKLCSIFGVGSSVMTKVINRTAWKHVA